MIKIAPTVFLTRTDYRIYEGEQTLSSLAYMSIHLAYVVQSMGITKPGKIIILTTQT